ncbi:uncharacterized protein LOC111461498 [Cucurbita moschata]|uniref:Uncharacterized protein LOC111461498 n=1 Tax=Cucurbita moschata TaxID=3662 RepID=A0A6J1HDB1_CUCMO|nr:uncharacterized protein LOC111461498 [Cucurbita moschata]
MKTVLFSTATAMEEGERSEARDRCYYPGCRKDANCNCKICLDSINATLDLMSYSVQKTSLMKLSASRPNVEATPISFNPLILTTPPSGTSRIMKYPNFISPVKLSLGFEAEEEERDSSSLHRFLTLVFVLSLIFVMTIGFSCAIARVIRPKLSVFVHDLNGKLWEVQGIVNLEISNGSCKDSMWEIDQEGMLLSSRCTMYKSAIGAVSLWGWPLQTAGLFRTGFSQRSITILSGRIKQWSDGGIDLVVREANTSLVQKGWGATPVQINPRSSVLEYRLSSLLENSNLNTMAADFFKHWMSKVIRRLKNNKLWLFLDVKTMFHQTRTTHDFKTPT